MSDPNKAPATPAPSKPIPWLGNLYGAINWEGTPAPLTETAVPTNDATKVEAAPKPAKAAKAPAAPLHVHVHNGPKKEKKAPKADEAAK